MPTTDDRALLEEIAHEAEAIRSEYEVAPTGEDTSSSSRSRHHLEALNPMEAFDMRRVKAIALKCVTLPLFLAIYMQITAQGIRSAFPASGQKLGKTGIPGFHLMGDYKWSYRLDLAHAMALMLMMGSYWFLVTNFRYMLTKNHLVGAANWDRDTDRLVVGIMGILVLIAEAFFLYHGTGSDALWGAATSASAAFFGCFAILAFIVGVTYVTVVLERN